MKKFIALKSESMILSLGSITYGLQLFIHPSILKSYSTYEVIYRFFDTYLVSLLFVVLGAVNLFAVVVGQNKIRMTSRILLTILYLLFAICFILSYPPNEIWILPIIMVAIAFSISMKEGQELIGNDSMDKVIIGLASAILGALVNILAKKLDFKGIVAKAEIENKDDIYDNWRVLYDTVVEDRKELTKANTELTENNKRLEEDIQELRSQISDLQRQIQNIQSTFKKNEEGYINEIKDLNDKNSKLKRENRDLIERNALLTEDYISLKKEFKDKKKEDG